MKDQFVPYELAVKLKELGLDEEGVFNSTLGFDEPCFARFRRGEFQLNTLGKPNRYNSHQIVDGDVSAPLWQQAFDWFREKHNIECTIFDTRSTVKTYKARVAGHYIKDEKLHLLSHMGLDDKLYENYRDAQVDSLEVLVKVVKKLKDLGVVKHTCERCKVALATGNYSPGFYQVCDSCANVLDAEQLKWNKE